MTNKQVIEKFLAGETKAKSGNLSIEANNETMRLINYSTCLMEYQIRERVLHVNKTKYSSTTSKIQYYIRQELAYVSHTIVEHDDIRMGRGYLI